MMTLEEEYDKIKPEIWKLIDSFKGRKFGKTEIRSYISMLTEIDYVENGSNIASSLYDVQKYVEKILRGGISNLINDYEKVYRIWLDIDRSNIKMEDFIPLRNRLKHKKNENNGLNVISLFTGAYGLDLGFEEMGFNITVTLDMSKYSLINIKTNRPKIPFIHDDISNVSSNDILKESGLTRNEVDVITGGPPCQPFSVIGKRQGMSDPRSKTINEYIRVVKDIKPKVFVMEEVPGILNMRLNSNSPKGSLWENILHKFESIGYIIQWKILNAVNYGTPQNRQRVILIGVRPDIYKQNNVTDFHPKQTHSITGEPTPLLTIADVLTNIRDHIGHTSLGRKYSKFMNYIPPGGNWRQIPDELKIEAMNNSIRSSGGKTGTYRRLSWFEPSPTLVTTPTGKATMRIHPIENRPLSVREYLRIQGFPDEWRVPLSITQSYKLFGEAVPVPLSREIARRIKEIIVN